MTFPIIVSDTGWVIEFTQFEPLRFVGQRNEGLACVEVDDPHLIRFKRKEDAENMLTVLRSIPGLKGAFVHCAITERFWT